MVKTDVPKLNVLVAGDPGTGKANFIKRFLYYYPSSAEVRRKNVTIHFMYKPDKNYKIQLHDASNIKTIEDQFFDTMDVVFFCYAANDRRSFENLEKWIQLMKVEKKEIHSFLVADMSDVGSQRDVAELLAEQARKLKESFRIKRFIESSFDDEETASSAFQTILNEVFPPKLNDKRSLGNESSEKLTKARLTKGHHCVSGPSRQGPICRDFGNADIKKMVQLGENLPNKLLEFF